MASDKPLIVIVGPTASGKTGLAIQIAKQYGGEVVCADSRTVYKHMNIGTAKPSLKEQDGIPHWGLDLAEPNERYTAAEFKKYADQKIAEIRNRGSHPILVGGTGLYVDAVLFDYDFPAPISNDVRKKLEQMNKDELYKYCVENNIELPEDDKNARRLLRAIADPERSYRRELEPLQNSIVVGIVTKNDELRERIHLRTNEMFQNGVVEETTTLVKNYGWNVEAMTSKVYRDIRQYLDGSYTLEQTKLLFETRDWQLAKRQMTWFRRNPFIEWAVLSEAFPHLQTLLADE